VLVVAEGATDRLSELLAWLHQGPPGARVAGLQHQPAACRGEFHRFSVEY
jgi:acylphosphatase